MTYSDDYIQLPGIKRYLCVDNGLSWPPPEQINFNGQRYARLRMSTIIDDQRSRMANVCRGAEYELIPSQLH